MIVKLKEELKKLSSLDCSSMNAKELEVFFQRISELRHQSEKYEAQLEAQLEMMKAQKEDIIKQIQREFGVTTSAELEVKELESREEMDKIMAELRKHLEVGLAPIGEGVSVSSQESVGESSNNQLEETGLLSKFEF